MKPNSFFSFILFGVFLLVPNTSLSDCRDCCLSGGGVVCNDGETQCGDGTPLSETCKAQGCDVCAGNRNFSYTGGVSPILMLLLGDKGYHNNTFITELVSVSSTGVQGNTGSGSPSISSNGRFVAFESSADNLVEGDTNNLGDVFVHDRQTGQTTRASASSSGMQGNGHSNNPAISIDGLFVAFSSGANNLVEGDTNGRDDVFVHDRQTGQTIRVSASSSGIQGNGHSNNPSLSSDNRFVTFVSWADNLVLGDTNTTYDVFVHDRQTGQTTRVSVSSTGEQGNALSDNPSISSSGRFVAFRSQASNLVDGDTNNQKDVFVHDRQTAQTSRVSISSTGEQGNGSSQIPSISSDGLIVAFSSDANNLVEGDTDRSSDIFVHDRQTGQTTLVSVSSTGAQGNSNSYSPSISSDGMIVTFWSWADNLVVGDTNGWDDVFVHDRQAGQTTRVNVSSYGEQGNQGGSTPSISAEGQFVVFSSTSSNLIEGDTNSAADIFFHHRNPASTSP